MAWGIVAGASAGVLVLLVLIGELTRRPARALPESVCREIARLPERRANQHVVDLELVDGRRIQKVWIAWGRYPAMIGGRTLMHRYRPRDVVHAHGRRSDPG